MAQERTRALDGVQGVVGFAGVMLGLIPLGGWIIAGTHNGPFRWLFGEQTGPMGYVAPLLVIAVAIVVIGALEKVKRR
ncbi:hypothetical protein [Prauserella cavernicola]|uniref:Uncharacterized protein n=1 Tax=Prauserella cavernicola TaxID=2800127 RepID=A0A934V5B6_9PSEU|nr:hypothetical protein [Prauserella cavernicola]MBK1785559.1 hypothetical protein [Prauserella cavernicola]